MQRWSIKYFDTIDNTWKRNYYYSLKEFNTAREKIEADETKTQVFDNYEKFPATPILDSNYDTSPRFCEICGADTTAGHYYSCPNYEM